MKYFNKILKFCLFFIFISHCGFEPIYSLSNKKEIKVGIIELEVSGDHAMNRNIERLLSPYKNTSGKSIFIKLDVTNSFTKEIDLKDSKGNPSQYLITMTTNLSFDNLNTPLFNEDGEKRWRNRQFSRKFNYQNLDNKFDLRRYEESIRKNLSMQINQEIILYLSKIK